MSKKAKKKPNDVLPLCSRFMVIQVYGGESPLEDYFVNQGLPMVTVERASELPMQDPATGQFYQVRVQFKQEDPPSLSGL